MRIFRSIMFCLLLMLGMGCQANLVEGTPDNPQPSITVTGFPNEGGTTLMSPTLELPLDRGIQELIDQATADLAARLSISTSEIHLVEATPVVWPDSSLGCPQPGMGYLQVPEDGLLIRLGANGQVYAYHSGGSRGPFLCETVQKDPTRLPPIDLFNLTPPSPNTSSTPDNSIPPGEGT